MKRYTLFILALLAFAFVRAQNKDLERLLQKQRSNPAIEYVNLLETGPEAENVKVAETLDFDDSLYLVRHFVEEYKQIKGFQKLKPSKVLSIDGNFFMKMESMLSSINIVRVSIRCRLGFSQAPS